VISAASMPASSANSVKNLRRFGTFCSRRSTLITTGNPFGGALFYVSPDYVAAVNGSLAKVGAGSSDAALVTKARSFPTAGSNSCW